MANIKRANTAGVTKTGTAVSDVVDAPTIGTATGTSDGSLTASITFTPAVTGGAATSYGAISDPDSLTGTSATSPITVSGLTADTAYTFQVYGINSSGTWSSVKSAASNSATSTDPSAVFLISRTSPTSGTNVSFTSIPNTYKSLQLRITGFAATASNSALQLTMNNDSAGNYTRHTLSGNGTTVSVNGSTLQQYVSLGDSTLGITTTNPYVYIVDIIDYASTSKYKTVRILSGSDRNGSGVINLNSGLWLSTSAITRLDVGVVAAGDSFASGTTVALYGIKGS